jgi:hypothetical protein
MSMLGGSLLGQRRFDEAETHILTGYQGMKAREAKIPASGSFRLFEAAERVVRLYDAWGTPEEATRWRSQLGRDAPELPFDIFARG